MNKLVFYFHGLNSNINSEKVQKLKQHFTKVYCFPIDIDYQLAYQELTTAIDNVLLDGMFEDIGVVFVGTSLGGFWAGHLANLYDCKAILINPVFDPKTALNNLGVDQELCNEYPDLKPKRKHHVFISVNDEVLTFPEECLTKYQNVYKYTNSDHRFSGPEFNDVIALIERI